VIFGKAAAIDKHQGGESAAYSMTAGGPAMMRSMWGGEGEWSIPFFGIGPLLFILLAAGLFYYFMRQSATDGRRSSGPTARGVLDRRYAAGEITKEQYDQMKQHIAG
jgi:putative membrane protein